MIEFLEIGLHLSIYTKKTVLERLQIQVSEDIQEHMVPQHHDSGGRYGGEGLAHHGHYVGKISNGVSKRKRTYFFEVGCPPGLMFIVFRMPKKSSMGYTR